MITQKYVIIVIIMLIIISCKKHDDFSSTPVIEYKNHTQFVIGGDFPSKNINITLNYIDGDGDLCFYDEDTTKNIIFTMYHIENDSLILSELEMENEFKIPFYEPEGRNKLMKGSIITEILSDNFVEAGYDSVLFKFYVFDRAKNKSNIGSTPIIIVK